MFFSRKLTFNRCDALDVVARPRFSPGSMNLRISSFNNPMGQCMYNPTSVNFLAPRGHSSPDAAFGAQKCPLGELLSNLKHLRRQMFLISQQINF